MKSEGKVWSVFAEKRGTRKKWLIREFDCSEGYNRQDAVQYANNYQDHDVEVYVTDKWFELYSKESNNG